MEPCLYILNVWNILVIENLYTGWDAMCILCQVPFSFKGVFFKLVTFGVSTEMSVDKLYSLINFTIFVLIPKRDKQYLFHWFRHLVLFHQSIEPPFIVSKVLNLLYQDIETQHIWSLEKKARDLNFPRIKLKSDFQSWFLECRFDYSRCIFLNWLYFVAVVFFSLSFKYSPFLIEVKLDIFNFYLIFFEYTRCVFHC